MNGELKWFVFVDGRVELGRCEAVQFLNSSNPFLYIGVEGKTYITTWENELRGTYDVRPNTHPNEWAEIVTRDGKTMYVEVADFISSKLIIYKKEGKYKYIYHSEIKSIEILPQLEKGKIYGTGNTILGSYRGRTEKGNYLFDKPNGGIAILDNKWYREIREKEIKQHDVYKVVFCDGSVAVYGDGEIISQVVNEDTYIVTKNNKVVDRLKNVDTIVVVRYK
jgi:hypothetical protein